MRKTRQQIMAERASIHAQRRKWESFVNLGLVTVILFLVAYGHVYLYAVLRDWLALPLIESQTVRNLAYLALGVGQGFILGGPSVFVVMLNYTFWLSVIYHLLGWDYD